MIIMILSVIVFNTIALWKVNKMSVNQIVHIWVFTIAFQLTFDIFVDLKYHGYWYVTKGIDWIAFPAYTVLIPPVNLLFINWFPFGESFFKKLIYFSSWEVFLLIYELIANLPSPWGYFRYGWWNLWYSGIVNPLLLIILILYYKQIRKIEDKLIKASTNG
jgi:hypothetical protein